MKMRDKVIKIIADCTYKDIKEINEETSLIADLGLDSLEMIELKMAFEEEMHIEEIPSEDYFKIDTVGEIISYFEKR